MSFNKKFALALAPLSLMATPACAQSPATPIPDADPAMWVVKDDDTTIYLFGTFHALDGKSDWFNDEVKTAFDKSDELVLEIITPENPAELQPVIMKYGLDLSGRTLTSKLSPEGQKRLAAELGKYGMPVNALDVFKPFFAAITLTTLHFQKLGITPDQGSEKILRTAAKAGNKPVGEVETIEYQLGLFDALSEADQVAMLEQGLAEADSIDSELGKMLAAWNGGDAESLATLVQKSEADSPALYTALFLNRNRNWSDWIKARLDKPGTVFMAVGAGHLAGKDSVQSMLKEKGIASTRVPNQQ